MKSRKRHTARRASACADEIHADDGPAAAEKLFRESFTPRSDRKALQLCGQVRRTLSLAFSGELADPVLQTLEVDAVVPAPDASRLLVRVRLPIAPTPQIVVDVLERLGHARGRLRHEIARDIVRKRVPELTFQVTGGSEVTP